MVGIWGSIYNGDAEVVGGVAFKAEDAYAPSETMTVGVSHWA